MPQMKEKQLTRELNTLRVLWHGRAAKNLHATHAPHLQFLHPPVLHEGKEHYYTCQKKAGNKSVSNELVEELSVEQSPKFKGMTVSNMNHTTTSKLQICS